MLILCLLNTCVQARWRIQGRARAPDSGCAVDREGTQFQSARQPAQRNEDTMPVGLGLEVPDWGDDSGSWAAPAKLKSSSDQSSYEEPNSRRGNKHILHTPPLHRS